LCLAPHLQGATISGAARPPLTAQGVKEHQPDAQDPATSRIAGADHNALSGYSYFRAATDLAYAFGWPSDVVPAMDG
jgi:hypothetical protein